MLKQIERFGRGARMPGLSKTRNFMLSYAVVFLIVAIIAAFFGFYALAGTAALVGRIVFIIFLVLFIAGLLRTRTPPRV
jgi:uncharacterized membrane protein YtjA (UPF0391 family)